ncbi:hypothetical protein LWI28_026196 [Acer negundo]|uniref:DUF1985 domain-containing protein n=1 Tax=Acer negundo TaxID=4023 RepID=A0AAD5NQU1_ACENE|nr:hypothetical protein LWI28_026196 [Acer negundo]
MDGDKRTNSSGRKGSGEVKLRVRVLVSGWVVIEICIPGVSEDELWFAIGKTKVRFGKRDFSISTGMKFSRLFDIPSREYEVVLGGIHARYFQERKKVVIADLKVPFMAEGFERPHDALKLALLLFANRVLFG